MTSIYRYEFRYRSLFQIWSGVVLIALAIACFLAIQLHLVFLVLSLLLFAGAIAVWIGIARNDVAWLELNQDAIAWSSTGIGAGGDAIPYSHIASLNLRNLSDSQSLLIERHDGSVVACSDLYFGDGMEILAALASARPELQLMLNDTAYDSEPSVATEAAS
ncbi:hypothetical protein Enr13x_47700 [Stieleria neptunia]|uniref:PH domain-containing protein n=1 Tax=Stieleria neptunia TaxID=2527979 RepID=A0A518HVN2_9BACT|nr:hypothetical protein [Stieleria neptunia]QDV44899.1 hypothetical protein Enr13x_47700 [Stieleria neptunia]